MRVLLVEDDRMIAQGLQTALRQDGHAVDWMQDGLRGAEALRTTQFDLVLLDLGLPGKDGLDVLRGLRSRGDATPVIILTARDEISDRIAGWSLRPQSKALAHGARVEIEDCTDALEGVWPACLPGEQPLLHLIEDAPTATIDCEAIFLNGMDRVVQDGDPEPLLRCQCPASSEVLRGQDHVRPANVRYISRQITICIHD